jgi:cellulose synthase/poly-beta-1,6-N-acetylglucosamine synthase-like glycosyltransferase
MDVQSFLLYTFGAISTLYVIHFGIYLTGANFYDIWQYSRQRRNGRGAVFFDGRPPLVSILIPAHNEEKVIRRCLESVIKSTYEHIEIFVVDDASSDNTFKITHDFARSHTIVPIRVIRKRINVGKGKALNCALKKHARGDLVMTLDADSLLLPHAIEHAVSYFEDPAVAGVAANVQIIDDFTVLGVLQKFEHMIGYRSKKVYSLTNCEFVIGGVASTYRMDILRHVNFYDTDTVTEDIGLSMKIISNGNRAHRIIYGVDVVAMTEGVDSFKALLKQRYRWKYGSFQNIIKYHHLIGTDDMRFSTSLALYRMPMAIISEFILLLSPIVWGYVLYITLSQRTAILLIGAYVTVSLYTLITIWSDEHLKISNRFHLTMYVPLAYFIFYIMDIVQVIAVVHCIVKSRTLLLQKSIGGTWTSPKRIGREVSTEL